MPELPADLGAQVACALREDLGAGDLTAALVPAGERVRGHIVTREAAVLCGRAWADETYRQLDAAVQLTWQAQDGESLRPGQPLCQLAGPARAVLSGERTALNFLQLLSGTATAARAYAEAIAGTRCQILDTRKTVPGLRSAQKYAVRCGGATNHRMGLFDQILIKENHILAAGSITAAVAAARRAAQGVRVEVEVEDLSELREALAAAPDIVLLDDFTLEDLRAAVRLRNAQHNAVQLEASGSVSLQSVRAVAETGVDFISVGAITKHVRAVDLSMRLDPRSA